MAVGNRLVVWSAIIAASIALLVVASVDDGSLETDAERIQRLSESFACPQCQGQSVSESNAAVAATIRGYIADEVAAGASDTEIRDALIRAYTARVLLNPPADGLARRLWIRPVGLVVGGAVVVSTMVGRSGAASTGTVTEADRDLVDQARSGARAQLTVPADTEAGEP